MWNTSNISTEVHNALTSIEMNVTTTGHQGTTQTLAGNGHVRVNTTFFDEINATLNSKPSNIVDKSFQMFFLYNVFYYGIFLVCAIGLLSNILVMLTMISSSKLYKNSGGTLILSLAFVDCSLVVSLAIDWYDFYFKVIKDFNYCLVFAYYWHIVRSLSHLIVMLISINRFALVCYPFTHNRFTSRKSAIFQLIGLVTFSSLGSIYTFYSHNPNAEFCTLNPETRQIYFIGFSIVDTLLSNFLPLIVTFVLTFKVIRSLSKHKDSLKDAVISSKQKMEKNLTNALLAVNVVFLILTLPHITGHTTMFFYELLVDSSDQTYANLVTSWHALYLLESINYVINLFLYLWYSPAFRNAFVRLLRCRCKIEEESIGSKKEDGNRATATTD